MEKLAETRVLTGFSRVNSPGVNIGVTPGGRSTLSLETKPWLPAIRVFGEGIFLTLREDRIENWLNGEAKKYIPSRAQVLAGRAQALAQSRGWQARNIAVKFFLLHAVAHAIIRRLSFNCGYGSSSLRERIYCDGGTGDPMQGILIYTAAGDCEGTLGGLVQQGKPGYLDQLLKDAVSDAIWCSSDPVCIESEGQGSDSLNLAACHACLLLPETSCEEGNRLLDRAFLTGTHEHPEIGFFSELADSIQRN